MLMAHVHYIPHKKNLGQIEFLNQKKIKHGILFQ